MQSPIISILIVNFNGKHHLSDCLNSIYAQSVQNFEIVLVDNASSDGSTEWLAKAFPVVKVLHSPTNLGFAGGNNFGLPQCSGDWIFLLNNDTVLEPNCLKELLYFCKNNPEHIVACLMSQWQSPNLIDSAGDFFYRAGPAYSRKGVSTSHPIFEKPHEVFSACAGAAVFPKKVLDQIGYFDEDLFLNFEDMDLCLRARHAGYTVSLVPTAQVRHKGSATIGRYTRTSVYYSVRNQFLVRIKNYPTLTLLKFLPMMIATGALSLYKASRNGCLRFWLEARYHQLLSIPAFIRKRRSIMRASVWTRGDFEPWLRRGWVRDYYKRTRGITPEP